MHHKICNHKIWKNFQMVWINLIMLIMNLWYSTSLVEIRVKFIALMFKNYILNAEFEYLQSVIICICSHITVFGEILLNLDAPGDKYVITLNISDLILCVITVCFTKNYRSVRKMLRL